MEGEVPFLAEVNGYFALYFIRPVSLEQPLQCLRRGPESSELSNETSFWESAPIRGRAGGRITSCRTSSFLTNFEIVGQGYWVDKDLTRAEKACWAAVAFGVASGGAMVEGRRPQELVSAQQQCDPATVSYHLQPEPSKYCFFINYINLLTYH